MKSLELTLKERLIIVELSDDHEAHYKEDLIYKIDEEQAKYSLLPKGEFKLICKGSELTEEHLWPDKDEFKAAEHLWIEATGTTFTQELDAFISAIEATGYHWGENPVKLPTLPVFINPNSEGFSSNDIVDFKYEEHLFYEAESRTFNPEKTLIFKII